jgi:hypothetical protein
MQPPLKVVVCRRPPNRRPDAHAGYASTVGRASRLLVADVAPQVRSAVPVDAETPLFAGDALVPA